MNKEIKDTQFVTDNILYWLQKRGKIADAEATLDLAGDESDLVRRRIAIRFAVGWCIAFESGFDGKVMHETLLRDFEQFVLGFMVSSPNEFSIVDEEDPAGWFWTELCCHAAQISFSGIETGGLFNLALLSVYWALLPDGFGIPGISDVTEQAIEKSLINTGRNYGVCIDGLASKLVFWQGAEVDANIDVLLSLD